jgi:LysM repeat protein
MERRTSASARIFAALALVGALLVVVVAVASNSGGDGSSSGGHHRSAQTAKHRQQAQKPPPAVYVVQTGDTLTSIAHETGVPIAKILSLNPEVDPQILTAGEKLKLR